MEVETQKTFLVTSGSGLDFLDPKIHYTSSVLHINIININYIYMYICAFLIRYYNYGLVIS